jgi:hypothetical protein
MAARSFPAEVVLGPPGPNPFSSQTTLAFDLPEASSVRLSVYDVLGREVAVLVEGAVAAGSHAATFEAAGLPNGVYVVRLEVGGLIAQQQVTLVR